MRERIEMCKQDNFEEELGCDNKYFADVDGIPVDLFYVYTSQALLKTHIECK